MYTQDRCKSIGRPLRRRGFFEITYRLGKPGCPEFSVAKHCLLSEGYQAAKADFEALDLGLFLHVREIGQEAFLAWQGVA